MYICRVNMKKTLLMLAALSAALTLSAQQIRTNYRSEAITHISTDFEKAEGLETRVELVGFPDGSEMYLLYIDIRQKTAFTAPRDSKMSATLKGGKVVRADQIGKDSPTKKKLQDGKYLNRLKYAVEVADMEAMARGVTSLELATGWNPDDYLRYNFSSDTFASLLKRHLEAIAAARESTIDLTAEPGGYINQTGSIMTAAQPLVADGVTFPYNVSLNHLYYKETVAEDFDLSLQIGTEDSHPIRRNSPVTFTLEDGSAITLPQTLDEDNYVCLYPTMEQMRTLAFGNIVRIRFETEKGALEDTFEDNALSKTFNQQYQLLLSLSAR